MSGAGVLDVCAGKWLCALCCFVAPFEGHVEVIHGELRLLFISDPVLCQLDVLRPCDVWIQRICCKEFI